MFKKTALWASAVIALSALGAPLAGAEKKPWLEHGVPVAGEKTTSEADGHFGFFDSEIGGITCPIQADIKFQEFSNTARVFAFNKKSGSSCTYAGSLDPLCGDVDVFSATKLPWLISATKWSPGVFGFELIESQLHMNGTGILCPDVVIEGTFIYTGNPHASTFQAEGSVYSPTFKKNLPVLGTLELTPAGTYTIET